MPTSPTPLLSYIYNNFIVERAPFMATSEHVFLQKMKESANAARHYDLMDSGKKKERQRKNKERMTRDDNDSPNVTRSETRPTESDHSNGDDAGTG